MKSATDVVQGKADGTVDGIRNAERAVTRGRG
jgi:hypothetical protein